ncbi:MULTISPECIES: C25 family cysteine peptidase [Serratia]|uniref:C25 family cysteine peptidase n=1 Tax=Serratia TaxID=613 RepID=UPI0018D78A87|nr:MULTISPECIES: C25 family cysteine peptidase [Serratia]MBH2704726.1 hypothetical protein [Serratia marcescens]MBH3190683.1 hypothetical protein [Serratia marcescens]SMP46178.1 Peptidase family C25 [Serratia sp. CC22-02]
MIDEEQMPLLAFGIHADTGLPLETGGMGQHEQHQSAAESLLGQTVGAAFPNRAHLGLQFGFDADQLSESGWGLIFAANRDSAPHLAALAPLIELRRRQAGGTLRIFAGPDGYRQGESASGWLNRHGSSLDMINPDLGMPYYLVLIGSPEAIPFEFQYALDLVAGVGRLDFPTLEEFTAYADSVVAHETDATRKTARRIELFATRHDFDRATQLFIKHVATPFGTGTGSLGPLGEKYRFALNSSLSEQATKACLSHLLSAPHNPPSLLITGTHGMAFQASDPRLAEHQGALVCQDWPAYGDITHEHWFAAQDIPEHANVHGMIHLFFACYGAGTPAFDNFLSDADRVRIAPHAMTARLPQKLMTLPQGGVLASLGHIDRVWASSFLSEIGMAQPQRFRDVIHRLLAGQRVGMATDAFNGQWGVLSTRLLEKLNNKLNGQTVPAAELLTLQIARDDIRNYVVLGDPAVRLKPEQDHVSG